MLYNFFQVREICEVINAGTQPMQNSCVMNKHSEIQEERVAWSQFWVNKGLIAVEVLVIFYIENLMINVELLSFFPELNEWKLCKNQYCTSQF